MTAYHLMSITLAASYAFSASTGFEYVYLIDSIFPSLVLTNFRYYNGCDGEGETCE